MNNRHVLSILVENYSGTLSKIAGLFSRRGYNIDTLNVAATQNPNLSIITVTVTGDGYILEQITKQLNKLINVIKITNLTDRPSVLRELVLLKINSPASKRTEIMETAEIFRANIVDVSNKSVTIEITGDEEKINAFIDLVKPHGIIEMTRTGLTAIERG